MKREGGVDTRQNGVGVTERGEGGRRLLHLNRPRPVLNHGPRWMIVARSRRASGYSIRRLHGRRLSHNSGGVAQTTLEDSGNGKPMRGENQCFTTPPTGVGGGGTHRDGVSVAGKGRTGAIATNLNRPRSELHQGQHRMIVARSRLASHGSTRRQYCHRHSLNLGGVAHTTLEDPGKGRGNGAGIRCHCQRRRRGVRSTNHSPLTQRRRRSNGSSTTQRGLNCLVHGFVGERWGVERSRSVSRLLNEDTLTSHACERCVTNTCTLKSLPPAQRTGAGVKDGKGTEEVGEPPPLL